MTVVIEIAGDNEECEQKGYDLLKQALKLIADARRAPDFDVEIKSVEE